MSITILIFGLCKLIYTVNEHNQKLRTTKRGIEPLSGFNTPLAPVIHPHFPLDYTSLPSSFLMLISLHQSGIRLSSYERLLICNFCPACKFPPLFFIIYIYYMKLYKFKLPMDYTYLSLDFGDWIASSFGTPRSLSSSSSLLLMK